MSAFGTILGIRLIGVSVGTSSAGIHGHNTNLNDASERFGTFARLGIRG